MPRLRVIDVAGARARRPDFGNLRYRFPVRARPACQRCTTRMRASDSSSANGLTSRTSPYHVARKARGAGCHPWPSARRTPRPAGPAASRCRSVRRLLTEVFAYARSVVPVVSGGRTPYSMRDARGYDPTPRCWLRHRNWYSIALPRGLRLPECPRDIAP